MKRLLYLIIFIGCGVTAHAQYQFQATSLSEALILLDQSSKRYDISFVYDELEDFTRPWIEGSQVADKIVFSISDAIAEAPRMGIVFDMVFLDGDKRTYLDAYEMALGVLRPGGFILADNTLWDGHVLETPKTADRQTLGIEQFNDFVARDPRVERVILPLRDGLTLIRKR